jgi:Alginate lyase
MGEIDMKRPWAVIIVLTTIPLQCGEARAQDQQAAIKQPAPTAASLGLDLKQLEHERVLKAAAEFLHDEPITVTAAVCPRSAGGPHDFYSEGDYWWPNPNDPDGPYIQRDGMTNPENFVEHRHAMIRFSIHAGTLICAYRLTGDAKYADAAIKHLRAWFIDDVTKMNPNLQYAQAIKGVTKGRGIGIIDTVHLVEVARAAQILEQAGVLKGDDLAGVKKWFADYLHWLTTHANGLDEMKAKNNHGTCFVMQEAAFAAFTGDQERLAECRKRFKEILLPKQMAADGSFPEELRRTKPYGYSLFNADAMATVCQILSTPQENLWQFTTEDGRNMRKAVEYLYPYIKDKSTWPHKHDVMFWEFWPVRSPILLFGGLAYGDRKAVDLWKTLEANPTNEEVVRNLPIRHPLLWVE